MNAEVNTRFFVGDRTDSKPSEKFVGNSEAMKHCPVNVVQ
jgi:hypothetical protein